MALLGSAIPSEVGLRLLLCPIGSNIVTRTACCTVGIGLPIYSTFKAIEKKDRNEQEKWLLYWAAYGSFSLVEVFSDKILSWFPFYYHMKFAFLVWLQLPSGNEKFMSAHHGEIQFVKALVVKCAMTANQMVKDLTHPVQPQGQNMIEGPSPPTRRETHDSGSDAEN
uniref:HVA22-like protein n=1 Tax=Elaeis guineensis var. tenera TaxID=51953 RepID=A0A8N4IE98_ELAGV|nr:HVA22-like protein k isoform X2 [Elaeis guineensis]